MKKLNLSTTKRAWKRSKNFYVLPVILIRRIVIYPVGSAIHLLNSRGLIFSGVSREISKCLRCTYHLEVCCDWSTFFFPLVSADVHVYWYRGGLREEPKERLRRRQFQRKLWSLVSVLSCNFVLILSNTFRVYCVFGYKRFTMFCVYRRFIAPSL